MAYYKLRYVPNNLTFVVTGDVDAQKVRSQQEALKDYRASRLSPCPLRPNRSRLAAEKLMRNFLLN